jgi:carbamoyl-phosphate synthase small subunit
MEDATFKSTQLVLQDGSIYQGRSPAWQEGLCYGEVVFTTGMSGYCAALTDPSFCGQLLLFTYPLIGNYGALPKSCWESERIQVRGVIVSQLCRRHSHSSALESLESWLQREKIPLIEGIDTRSLAIKLRTHGTMLGAIDSTLQPEQYQFQDPNCEELVAKVSIKERRILPHPPNAAKKIILVDCGVKENIVRELQKYPLIIHQVPYDSDFTSEAYDGVFISSGPGDPALCTKTIEIIAKAMELRKPIYGICLGAQIMALAAGGKTYKLPFGHRSQNQPCLDTRTQRCYITTQNHGYAVDASTLPKQWEVSFINLNDQTPEGIHHRFLPFAAVQFHPEACPGPTDTAWFFDQFYKTVSEQHA